MLISVLVFLDIWKVVAECSEESQGEDLQRYSSDEGNGPDNCHEFANLLYTLLQILERSGILVFIEETVAQVTHYLRQLFYIDLHGHDPNDEARDHQN